MLQKSKGHKLPHAGDKFYKTLFHPSDKFTNYWPIAI